MKEMIPFLKENHKEANECKCEASGGSSEFIYINPAEGANPKYAYKDEEYTLKYNADELAKAYDRGVLVKRIDPKYGPFIYTPLIKYDVETDKGSACMIILYDYNNPISVASEEFID